MSNFDTFHYGWQVKFRELGAVPMPIDDGTVIAIIGTAPDANTDIFPPNQPILVTSDAIAAKLGTAGSLLFNYNLTLLQCIDEESGERFRPIFIIIRVEEDADINQQYAKLIGDRTARTGGYGLIDAYAETNYYPDIIIAPGFGEARHDGAVNPVSNALTALGAQIGAVYIKGGVSPFMADGTKDVQALIDDMKGIRSEFCYYVAGDPYYFDTTTASYLVSPIASTAAGMFARATHKIGFWDSPGNRVAQGMAKFDPPWDYSEISGESDILLQNGINHFVYDGGWRLRGPYNSVDSTGTSRLITTTRIKIEFARRIKKAEQVFIERGMNKMILEREKETLQAGLEEMENKGAFLPGSKAYISAEANTAADYQRAAFQLNALYHVVVPHIQGGIMMEQDPQIVTDFINSIAG